MTIRSRIVNTALQLVGTPFQHRQMVPGAGIDCARSLEWVAKQCGLIPQDWPCPPYSPEWHLHQYAELFRGILAALGATERPVATREMGDILLFHYGHCDAHAAILTQQAPEYIVHAQWRRQGGKVVHTIMGEELPQRLRAVYAFPGVPL